MAIPLRIKWQLEKWETYIAKPYEWKRYKIKKGFRLANINTNENKTNWSAS